MSALRKALQAMIDLERIRYETPLKRKIWFSEVSSHDRRPPTPFTPLRITLDPPTDDSNDDHIPADLCGRY